MNYPNTATPGDPGMGSDANSLEERKKQLLQQLLQQRGQGGSGLQGTHAMPLFGGRGRGVAGAQQIGTPALNFNPFLSMAALHPGENFQAPNGLTMQALMQAQAGLPGPVGGAAPQQIQGQNIPSNSGAAANAYLGGGSTVAGLTGPSQPNNFENNPSNPYHFLDYDPNAVAPAPMPPRLNPVLGRLGSFIAV